MEYSKLLFTYNNHLGCLLFNEITLWDLINKTTSKPNKEENSWKYMNFKLKITNESYQDYLTRWLKIIYQDNLSPFQIIGMIDSDKLDYPILIDEKNKQIKILTETIDFDSKYKMFLESNGIWNGQVYNSNELDLNYWTSIKKSNKLKEKIREIDQETNGYVKLLDDIIYAMKDQNNETKRDYYITFRASLIAKHYKYAITNYKKINLKKFIIPIYVSLCKCTESRISKTYSVNKIELACDIVKQSSINSSTNSLTNLPTLFSVLHSTVMVDDGHDYYSSHAHTPTAYFCYNNTQSPFTELYMRHCLEFIMEKLFNEDITYCKIIDKNDNTNNYMYDSD